MIGFLAFLIASPAPGADSEPIRYRGAQDLLRVGHTSRALELLKETLENHPHHRKSFRLMVQTLSRTAGQETVASFVRRHVHSIGDPQFLVDAMDIDLSDTAYRVEFLNWAARNDLRHYRLDLERIRVLRSREQTTRALNLALSSLDQYPEIYDFHLHAGSILFSRSRVREAQDHFQSLIRMDPGRPEGYLWMHRVLKARKQPTQAQRFLERYRSLKGP